MSRPSCQALDDLIAHGAISVLDHGFVRVVDYMGDQSAIVQAARVSYGRGTKSVSEDRGLIRYLMRHRHTTPFEMCELKLHVKLPIFIARQWIRHRTASVNEYSARYSVLDREFYLPSPDAVCEQSSINKQGRSEPVSPDQAEAVIRALRQHSSAGFDLYEELLNDGTRGSLNENEPQIARELARIGLSLNSYTQWYWKIDLHNLLHFLSLRRDKHAQLEFRAYADVIWSVVEAWVPDVAEAFEDYVTGAVRLSRAEAQVIRDVMTRFCDESVISARAALQITAESGTALSKRELAELLGKLTQLGLADT